MEAKFVRLLSYCILTARQRALKTLSEKYLQQPSGVSDFRKAK